MKSEKIANFGPKALLVMLEFYYKERGLLNMFFASFQNWRYISKPP